MTILQPSERIASVLPQNKKWLGKALVPGPIGSRPLCLHLFGQYLFYVRLVHTLYNKNIEVCILCYDKLDYKNNFV
jgi:hypothetical protein